MALNLRLQEYFAEGREEGREEGMVQTLMALVKDHVLTMQEAITRSGLSEAEFTKLLNK